MNILSKIQKLWSYLQIQDNETLIIQVYNYEKKVDVFYIIGLVECDMHIELSEACPNLSELQPFKFIKFCGADGRHIIPSVSDLIAESESDY